MRAIGRPLGWEIVIGQQADLRGRIAPSVILPGLCAAVQYFIATNIHAQNEMTLHLPIQIECSIKT
jgi:hypothetical protein